MYKQTKTLRLDSKTIDIINRWKGDNFTDKFRNFVQDAYNYKLSQTQYILGSQYEKLEYKISTLQLINNDIDKFGNVTEKLYKLHDILDEIIKSYEDDNNESDN